MFLEAMVVGLFLYLAAGHKMFAVVVVNWDVSHQLCPKEMGLPA